MKNLSSHTAPQTLHGVAAIQSIILFPPMLLHFLFHYKRLITQRQNQRALVVIMKASMVLTANKCTDTAHHKCQIPKHRLRSYGKYNKQHNTFRGHSGYGKQIRQKNAAA